MSVVSLLLVGLTLTANVLRIDVGGLSECPVSTSTKGYIEDNCFLAKAETNLKVPKGQMA